MNRALALGHYRDVKYHPFEGVDRELAGILGGSLTVDCTEDYGALNGANLLGYQLFISYAEFSDTPVAPEQEAALLSYVAQGGGLLAIHNGISLQRNPALASLLGARFTGHPPYGPLPVAASGEGELHPIARGLAPFVIDDEPYRFELSSLLKPTVLLEYEHEGGRWPAAWAHGFGLGRVVYLMPGHSHSSFLHPAYRELILRAGLWAAGLEAGAAGGGRAAAAASAGPDSDAATGGTRTGAPGADRAAEAAGTEGSER